MWNDLLAYIDRGDADFLLISLILMALWWVFGGKSVPKNPCRYCDNAWQREVCRPQCDTYQFFLESWQCHDGPAGSQPPSDSRRA